MVKMIKLRPALQKFAEAMEIKLRKHDKERGEVGWHEEDFDYLFDRLQDEMEELAKVEGNSKYTQGECVDIANFAMMIFDNYY